MKLKSLSHVRLSATPWAAAYQAPPSMGFSRPEYWSGVPLPSMLQCLENPILFSAISGLCVAKAQYALPNLKTLKQFIREKKMATHSSTLAWKIPWMEEPGWLQSMGLQRAGHD